MNKEEFETKVREIASEEGCEVTGIEWFRDLISPKVMVSYGKKGKAYSLVEWESTVKDDPYNVMLGWVRWNMRISGMTRRKREEEYDRWLEHIAGVYGFTIQDILHDEGLAEVKFEDGWSTTLTHPMNLQFVLLIFLDKHGYINLAEKDFREFPASAI